MEIREMNEDVLILAIESSCDETAAAVVKNGRTVLSNVISSQISTHTIYGLSLIHIYRAAHRSRHRQGAGSGA